MSVVWWLAGCTVPLETPAEPEPEAELEPEPEVVVDLNPEPWPAEAPPVSDDPGCTGAVLSVWVDDFDVAGDLLLALVDHGVGRIHYSSDPGVLTWGPSDEECGYPDEESALEDLPVFLEILIAVDPAFVDYPYELVDTCPCIAP